MNEILAKIEEWIEGIVRKVLTAILPDLTEQIWDKIDPKLNKFEQTFLVEHEVVTKAGLAEFMPQIADGARERLGEDLATKKDLLHEIEYAFENFDIYNYRYEIDRMVEDIDLDLPDEDRVREIVEEVVVSKVDEAVANLDLDDKISDFVKDHVSATIEVN